MANKNFRDLFKEARMEARVLFRDISKACGLKIGELSDLEHGRAIPPDLSTVEKIERVLNVADGRLVRAAKDEFDFQNGKILNSHEFTVSVTRRQLYLIKEFIDVCSFLLMGKFENPLWHLFISREIDYELFHERAFALKQSIFPELDRHSSYGVGWVVGDSRQNKSQIGYEIEAMIGHELWRREDDRTDGGTRSHPPLHYSTEALIRVEAIRPVLPSANELLHEAGRRILENAVKHLRKQLLGEAYHYHSIEAAYTPNGIKAIANHLETHFSDGDGRTEFAGNR